MRIGPYLPLFDLDVEHAFFPDRLCAHALRFVLTPRSRVLLQRSGFFARTTDTGVAVLADSARFQALSLIARDTEEPFRLTWLVYAADPLFGNYTEGLVYPPEGLPVFDSDNAAADGVTGHWRLQRKAYVSAADAVPLDDEAVVQALAGQHVPPLFMVTLRLATMATEVPGARALAAESPPEPKHYVLGFATRTAVWKYWLIGDWMELDPQVVDPDGQAAFLRAQEATLPDGRAALTIRSVDPIAILRRSQFRFQLRGRAGNSDRVLVKRLPVAGPMQLTRERGPLGGPLISEIYVHR